MCGRFAIRLPDDEMARLFEARPSNDLPMTPNYNVCPTDRVHVIRSDGTSRRLVAMRWGFVPHWYKSPSDGPLLINARGETIAGKPAFRAAVRERRCIVPASGFYEWRKDDRGNRLPFYISRVDDEPMALAAVWQSWGTGDEIMNTVAIVTTGAGAGMSAVHHREPVMIAPPDRGLWLGEAGHGAAPLMRSATEGALRVARVDPEVNSNRAAGPQLIEPIA